MRKILSLLFLLGFMSSAFADEEFYEKLIMHNVWLFQMSEEDAAPFYRK